MKWRLPCGFLSRDWRAISPAALLSIKKKVERFFRLLNFVHLQSYAPNKAFVYKDVANNFTPVLYGTNNPIPYFRNLLRGIDILYSLRLSERLLLRRLYARMSRNWSRTGSFLPLKRTFWEPIQKSCSQQWRRHIRLVLGLVWD